MSNTDSVLSALNTTVLIINPDHDSTTPLVSAKYVIQPQHPNKVFWKQHKSLEIRLLADLLL